MTSTRYRWCGWTIYCRHCPKVTFDDKPCMTRATDARLLARGAPPVGASQRHLPICTAPFRRGEARRNARGGRFRPASSRVCTGLSTAYAESVRSHIDPASDVTVVPTVRGARRGCASQHSRAYQSHTGKEEGSFVDQEETDGKSGGLMASSLSTRWDTAHAHSQQVPV